MDKKTKSGYVAGVLFLLVFFAFLASIINVGLNKLDLLSSVLTITFGILGFGSLWKPKTIGAVAMALIDMFTKNTEKSSSDSHNKQIQSKSSGGVQVVATHGAKVNVNVPSEKRGNEQNLEEEILRNETISVRPSLGFAYELELKRGDSVKGKITSNSPVDIYFLDIDNFEKWDKDKRFNPEHSSESVLDTQIDFGVPKRGKWFLIIENNGRKLATVEVLLY